VHEQVKPFVCEFEGCGRAFGFKKVLQRHELTHTQPAPPRERKKNGTKLSLIDEIAGTGYEKIGRDIRCTVADCEWRFIREYDLKRHLASAHLQGNHDIAENDIESDIENDPSVTE
jgi:general transcription factor IIIA